MYSGKFSWLVDLDLFADVCTHANYVLYNQAYFTDFYGYKTAKIGPLKISRYTVVCVWMFTYNAGT